MPIYEYYCQNCDGIFEERRPVSEASEPMPCPVCYRDALRIMPTSFAAFTFRDGYPRRIPDDGKYYHFGQKVSKPLTRGRPNEHPEVQKPKPKPKLSKGELAEIREMRELAKRGELTDLYGNYVKPSDVRKMYEAGRIVKKGTPKYGLPPEGPSA